MMFRDEYNKLFDAVSPSAELEQRTERKIREMLNLTRKQRNHIRRTVCIAVIASMLVIGAAFAAVLSSGIMDRLFPNGEPSPQAQEALVRNSTSVSENGLTINMDEYLFDNNTMHFGWTVSSEKDDDFFYTTDYKYIYSNPEDEVIAENSIGGNYGAYSSGDFGDNALIHLNKNHARHSSYAGYAYSDAIQEPVTLRIVFHFYQTDYELTDVENSLDLIYADADDPVSLALEQAEQIGVGPDHLTAVNGYGAFNEAREKLLAGGMDWDEANEAALVESGIFREADSLELYVTADPASAAAPYFELDGEQRYELSDASVILKTFTVDTASTIVEYEVITDKVLSEGNTIGNGVTYILFDQNGNPLNTAYQMNMSAGQLSGREEKHVYSVSLSGNPLPESISSIAFIPTANIERNEGETTAAYYLRMAQLADKNQCFTIELKWHIPARQSGRTAF